MPKVSEEYRVARRNHILAAAVVRFADQGFHRTSIQDVIDEAGLSPGAVYRYFRSKTEIIMAISAEAMAAVGSELRRALDEHRSLPETVAQLPTALAGLDHADERLRIAVQAWGEALRDPALVHAMRRGLADIRMVLADRVRQGQRDGDVAAHVDPDAAARAVLGTLQGFILQHCMEPDVDPAPYGRAMGELVAGLLAVRRDVPHRTAEDIRPGSR